MDTESIQREHFEKLAIKELIELCDGFGIDSSECANKTDIIDRLVLHHSKQNNTTATQNSNTNSNTNPNPPATNPTPTPTLTPTPLVSENKRGSIPVVEKPRFRFTISQTIPVKSSTEKTFTAYLVEVFDESISKESKPLLKRYRQFFDLNESLKKDYPKRELPKLPSKKIVGNLNPEFVHKRCKKLENYLNIIAHIEGVFTKPFMHEFLEQAVLPTRTSSLRNISSKKKSSNLTAMKEGRNNSTGLSDYGSNSSSNSGTLDRNQLQISKIEDLSPEARLKLSLFISASDPPTNITELDVSSCKLPSIPTFLFESKATLSANITSLNLSSNKLGILSTNTLQWFKNLQVLDLSDNRLTYVESLSPLEKLHTLNLRKNSIKQLEKDFINLKNLKIIDISKNQISDAALSVLLCLENLTSLNISENSTLSVIPADIVKLKLHTLVAANCDLFQVPTELFKIENLQYIDISSNDIKNLPLPSINGSNDIDIIFDGRNLDDKDIESQLLSKLESNGYKSHKSLTYLDISSNPISQIPSTVSLFSELKNFLFDHSVLDVTLDSTSKVFEYLKKKLIEESKTENKEKSEKENTPSVIETTSEAPRSISRSAEEKTAPHTTQDKVVVIKQWGCSEIKLHLLPKLLELKSQIESSTSVANAKAPAQMIRNLKDIIDKNSQYNYWIRVKIAFNKLEMEEKEKGNSIESSSQTTDKLQSLKEITASVVKDLQLALNAVTNVLDSSTLAQEIIQLVKVIKSVKEVVESNVQ